MIFNLWFIRDMIHLINLILIHFVNHVNKNYVLIVVKLTSQNKYQLD